MKICNRWECYGALKRLMVINAGAGTIQAVVGSVCDNGREYSTTTLFDNEKFLFGWKRNLVGKCD